MVEVLLASASICFGGACYPALVGRATPTGAFTLRVLETRAPAYKGDVLAFHESKDGVFAVHRPPSERRRINLGAPDDRRRYVTDGCVNVTDAVYEALRTCCAGEQLTIR
jgi:hypothetical protein